MLSSKWREGHYRRTVDRDGEKKAAKREVAIWQFVFVVSLHKNRLSLNHNVWFT